MDKQKLLFTPGPLNTSETVKRAMLRDLGSRDAEFLDIVRNIRRRLLELGQVAGGDYAAVLMQGSGTFVVESVISSVLPRDGKLLVLINGAYGHRMAKIARTLGIATETLVFPESRPVDPAAVRHALASRCGDHPRRTHPLRDHHGNVESAGGDWRGRQGCGRVFIVDAMSSFGGMPIDLATCGIDFLVSSANKCIQGVPGFGFALARRDLLIAARGPGPQSQPRPCGAMERFGVGRAVPFYSSNACSACLLAGPGGPRGGGWNHRSGGPLRRQPPSPFGGHEALGFDAYLEPRAPKRHHHFLPLSGPSEFRLPAVL